MTPRPARRTPPEPYVAHLDADAFYLNAERVRHPDLCGKAVGVLGNNGACVIAKSYEMKAAGVKTGTLICDAAKARFGKPADVHLRFVGEYQRFDPGDPLDGFDAAPAPAAKGAKR